MIENPFISTDNQLFVHNDPTSAVSLRPVYLTDLKALINIYKAIERTRPDNDTPLKENFGIPLYLAEIDRKIAGGIFLCQHITNPADVSVCIRTHQAFDTSIAESLLSAWADGEVKTYRESLFKKGLETEKSLFSGQAFGYKNIQLFKTAVSRLVDWLNKCD